MKSKLHSLSAPSPNAPLRGRCAAWLSRRGIDCFHCSMHPRVSRSFRAAAGFGAASGGFIPPPLPARVREMGYPPRRTSLAGFEHARNLSTDLVRVGAWMYRLLSASALLCTSPASRCRLTCWRHSQHDWPDEVAVFVGEVGEPGAVEVRVPRGSSVASLIKAAAHELKLQNLPLQRMTVRLEGCDSALDPTATVWDALEQDTRRRVLLSVGRGATLPFVSDREKHGVGPRPKRNAPMPGAMFSTHSAPGSAPLVQRPQMVQWQQQLKPFVQVRS